MERENICFLFLGLFSTWNRYCMSVVCKDEKRHLWSLRGHEVTHECVFCYTKLKVHLFDLVCSAINSEHGRAIPVVFVHFSADVLSQQ